jgi:addiction module HigA family antidote
MIARPERKRRPTHPGEILLHDVIQPLGLTQTEFAERLRISYPRLNEIIHGKRGVTPDTALRIAALLGTSPEVWLNLQQAVDLWDAQNSTETRRALRKIEPVKQTA